MSRSVLSASAIGVDISDRHFPCTAHWCRRSPSIGTTMSKPARLLSVDQVILGGELVADAPGPAPDKNREQQEHRAGHHEDHTGP
jgi:hypothetical protein